MRDLCRTFGVALLLGACAALLGCSQTPPPPSPKAELYRVGGATFDFAGAEVLQIWPVLPFQTPPNLARVALQMQPGRLMAGLPDAAGSVVQIDVLAPEGNPAADQPLFVNFADWPGREVRIAGTQYHYDPHSKLLPDGGRAVYVRRNVAEAGLEALEPAQPDETAPIFYLRRSGKIVDTSIDCRAHAPPSTGTGSYCSLHRQIGRDYGYRVLFRRDLLAHWAKIDAAARDYLARAAARGGS
jgi:hypothetical protein